MLLNCERYAKFASEAVAPANAELAAAVSLAAGVGEEGAMSAAMLR